MKLTLTHMQWMWLLHAIEAFGVPAEDHNGNPPTEDDIKIIQSLKDLVEDLEMARLSAPAA